MSRIRVNFAVFALAAAGAGWLGVALDWASGVEIANGVALSRNSGTTGQALLILGPAVVALGLYRLSRDGAGPLGFTVRFADRARWFAASWALYPAMLAAAVVPGLLVGAASLTATPAPGKPAYAAAFVTILAIQLVKNVIEEFIFRGYGTRTALALGIGRFKAHVLAGLVWALWHLPLFIVWTSEADRRLVTSLPWLVALPLFLVAVVAMSLLYGEMRAQTGSIWPGVVLHSMANALVTTQLTNGHLGFTRHGDVLFSPAPTGLIILALFAVAGLYLLRRRPAAPVESEPERESVSVLATPHS